MSLLNTYHVLYEASRKENARMQHLWPLSWSRICFVLLPQPCTRKEKLHWLGSSVFTGMDGVTACQKGTHAASAYTSFLHVVGLVKGSGPLPTHCLLFLFSHTCMFGQPHRFIPPNQFSKFDSQTNVSEWPTTGLQWDKSKNGEKHLETPTAIRRHNIQECDHFSRNLLLIYFTIVLVHENLGKIETGPSP